MELKKQDLKLLSYLYHSYREPLSKVAKAVKMSRAQVEYQMNKYSREGIIKKNILMVNHGALGYNLYVFLLIRLDRPSKKKEVARVLEGTKRCMSWGECFGSYDIYANMIFKQEEDMEESISKIVSKGSIEDYQIIKPNLAEFHHLKILDKEKELILPLKSPKMEKVKLDEIDKKILVLLTEDARMSVVEIASRSKCSAEKVLYRLNNLKNKEVIIGLRLGLDMKKVGYSIAGFFMEIKNFSEGIKTRLVDFSRSHKLVNALVLSMTKPNCFIQVFHKSEEELKETIKEVKQLLGKEDIRFDILLMNEEDFINTLPFLN